MAGPKFGGAMWKTGRGANRSRTVRVIRSGMSRANDKYGISGVKKEGHRAPRPITLPKMPWEEQKP